MAQNKIWQINVIATNLQKVCDLILFYEKKSNRSKDQISASFLKNAADKKRIQLLILERMMLHSGIQMVIPLHTKGREAFFSVEHLQDKSLEDIFNFVNSQAIKDLKLYTRLAQEDGSGRRIFRAMADLEEDFLSFIEIDYLNHLSLAASRNRKDWEGKEMRPEYELALT